MFELQSPEIDKLTAAFIEARKAMKPVKEDAKANYGTYVSIAEIKSCTQEALLAHGLSLTQGRTFKDGIVFVVTKLTHTSGQWQASYVPLYIPENPKNVDQAYGASYSYQRRYELYGLFGIMGEDNDPDSIKNESPRSVPAPRPVSSDKPYPASEAQVKLLSSLLNGKDEILKSILQKHNASSLTELSSRDASGYIEKLKGK